MGAYIYDVDDNFVGSMERNYVYDISEGARYAIPSARPSALS